MQLGHNLQVGHASGPSAAIPGTTDECEWPPLPSSKMPRCRHLGRSLDALYCSHAAALLMHGDVPCILPQLNAPSGCWHSEQAVGGTRLPPMPAG